MLYILCQCMQYMCVICVCVCVVFYIEDYKISHHTVTRERGMGAGGMLTWLSGYGNFGENLVGIVRLLCMI